MNLFRSSHWMYSVKKVFLEISQNSQENTCSRVLKKTLAHVFSCELCEISKNTFSYRTTPLAALDEVDKNVEKTLSNRLREYKKKVRFILRNFTLLLQ